MRALIEHLHRRLSGPDPFAVVQGVFDALEGRAVQRGDTRAIGQLRDARATVVREAIRNLKP